MPPAVSLAVAAVTALPWLWPWAAPPSPAVPGLLVAWSCTAVLWFVSTRTSTGRSMACLWQALLMLGSLALWAWWRMPLTDLALLGGLVGSGLCIGWAAHSSHHGREGLSQALCWGLLIAAVASTLIGALQYSGLLHEPIHGLSWLHASPNEEAYGQLRQRNQYGSLMALGLAAWLHVARTGWPPASRWLAWPLLLVLTLGASMSSSRTGALTWVGLSAVTLMWTSRQTPPHTGPDVRHGAWVALLGFGVFSGLLPLLVSMLSTVALPKVSVFQRLATQPEGLGICESRTVLWRHVLELSWQRPWLGWGWGELDLAHATQSIDGERFCGQLGHAHNLLLQVAVEWGWPLALLALYAIVRWIWRHRPWQARTPAAILGWSWLGVIGLHSGLEFPLWYGPFQLVLGLAIGLVTRLAAAGPVPGPIPALAPTRAMSAHHAYSMRAIVSLWLACTLWAGWDYQRVSQAFLPPSQRSPACQVQPMSCVDEVVWFHQGRDFARLSLERHTLEPSQISMLAQRVMHFSPEPWVLSLASRTPPPSTRQ